MTNDRLLRRLLWLDCATCALMALAFALVGGKIDRMTGIPGVVRIAATGILIAAAALMALTAALRPLWVSGAWLVILGNIGWVAGSLWLLVAGDLVATGVVFVLIQTVAVIVLAWLEATALRGLRTA